MKIIFMGTPEFSVNVLQKLIDSNLDVALVISQPDKKVGRGQMIIETPVKRVAVENNLEVFQPENINEHVDVIKSVNPDFIVTCAYGQILKKETLELANIKAINVHASLLPKHRGGAPIHRAILNGDEYSGVSIMEMIPKMDAGNVFIQEKVKIEYEDTLASLHDKLSSLGASMIVEAINMIATTNDSGSVQDESKVTYSPNISKEERVLSFNDSSRNIYNKVRAFNPFPSTTIKYGKHSIKVFGVKELDKVSNNEPGYIEDITKDGIEVCTNDNNILITELVIPGKSKMNALQFYNGNKLIQIKGKFN